MATYLDPLRTKTVRTADGTNYAYYHATPSPGKPTFLLLHGYPSSAYDWRHLVPLISTAGFGIVAPDLLGYGGTDKPSDPSRYRMKVMSSQINDILEHEELQAVFAVAHDWGCGLLSRLLLYHPERFLACSFISLPYLPPAPLDIDSINAESKKLLGWEIFGYWDVLQRDNAAAMIENNYDAYESLTWTADNEGVKQHFAQKGGLEAFLKDGGKRYSFAPWISPSEVETSRKILSCGGFTGPTCWYKQSFRGLNDADEAPFSEDEKKIKIPIQFFATLDDPVCAPRIMLNITEPWVENLTVTELHTGHWPQMEQPENLAQNIIDFVGSFTKT